MDAEVRLLHQDDADAYLALRLRALRDHPTSFCATPEDEAQMDIAARLRPDDGQAVFGAFAAGAMVGQAGVFRDLGERFRHKATIWGVYTSPEARGAGIGRALVLACIAEARAWGCSHVLLSVNASLEPAVRLYSSLGFEAFGREPDFMQVAGVLQDELHMIRRLSL